jgi:hypothetical protein
MKARQILANVAAQIAARQSHRLFPAPCGFPVAGGVAISPTSQQDIDDADAWCGTNCTGRANRRSSKGTVIYEFERDRDATLFRLFKG